MSRGCGDEYERQNSRNPINRKLSFMSSITTLQRPSNGNDPHYEARAVFSKINSLVESLRIACGYDRDAGLCDDGRVRKYIRKSFPRRISIEGEAFRLGGVFTDAFGDQRIHYIAEGSV